MHVLAHTPPPVPRMPPVLPWSALHMPEADAAILARTLVAADAAERAARDFRAGLVSVECLILASDAAFHAARRAERAAEASGCPEMAAAASRARAAYRAGGRA